MGLKPNSPRIGGNAALVDQRTGTCKHCLCGIYKGQPTVWSRKPLGLIHDYCAPTEES